MPRGNELMNEEKIKILALKAKGTRQKQISCLVNRSENVISKFLRDPENYGKRKRSGRPKSITQRDIKMLINEAKKGEKSSRQLKECQNLNLSTRRIRQILNESKNVKYLKKKSQPQMTAEHVKKRMDWCDPKLTWNDDEWGKIIFSDEKKFNLDGPDGFNYYWHDVGKEYQYYSKRVHGGGSVMVWAGMSSKGKTPIVFLDGKQNSQKYTTILENHLLPFGQDLGGPNWIFQHDNAPIHTAQAVKQWFYEKKIKVLDWPAKSPDLNPIENLWGILCRQVYKKNQSFACRNLLKQAIEQAWNEIDVSVLQALSHSMKKRISSVFRRRGKSINY